jgi:molybdenum cofactor cytidylyltransferase
MAEAISCGVVLLAAGGSSRMGRAKQLLPVRGRPLVRHVAELVLRAPVAPVVVVLGAHADAIAPVLADLPVHVALNPDWSEGLGSSLRAGVAAARRQAPQLAALLVVLADQPEIPPAHLAALIARFREGGCTIVASSVGGVPVPPVLFAACWFDELERITGDQGARALLRGRGRELATIPLPSNADLDTPDDHERYTRTDAAPDR